MVRPPRARESKFISNEAETNQRQRVHLALVEIRQCHQSQTSAVKRNKQNPTENYNCLTQLARIVFGAVLRHTEHTMQQCTIPATKLSFN